MISCVWRPEAFSHCMVLMGVGLCRLQSGHQTPWRCPQLSTNISGQQAPWLCPKLSTNISGQPTPRLCLQLSTNITGQQALSRIVNQYRIAGTMAQSSNVIPHNWPTAALQRCPQLSANLSSQKAPWRSTQWSTTEVVSRLHGSVHKYQPIYVASGLHGASTRI